MAFDPNSAIGQYIANPKGEALLYIWDGAGGDAQTIGGVEGDNSKLSTGLKVTAVVNDPDGHPWLQLDTTEAGYGEDNGGIAYIPVFGDTSKAVPANTANPTADSIFNDKSMLVAEGTKDSKQKTPGAGGGTPKADPKGGGGFGFLTAWNPFHIHLKGDSSDYHDWVKLMFWIILSVILIKIIFFHKKK